VARVAQYLAILTHNAHANLVSAAFNAQCNERRHETACFLHSCLPADGALQAAGGSGGRLVVKGDYIRPFS